MTERLHAFRIQSANETDNEYVSRWHRCHTIQSKQEMKPFKMLLAESFEKTTNELHWK